MSLTVVSELRIPQQLREKFHSHDHDSQTGT
jgi:hypothetical protein